MEFDTIDSGKGELPDEYRPHFQGQARCQRFAGPFGDRPAVSWSTRAACLECGMTRGATTGGRK